MQQSESKHSITEGTPTGQSSGRRAKCLSNSWQNIEHHYKTHTHGEQEWEERNISNRLCDLEQACEHSDDHARLWNSFDTEVTVSIWLYLGQRERHNTYEPANTDATLIGSIQWQYTETGTLHSWTVYGDGMIHDLTDDSPDIICFHMSVDTLEWISSIRGLYTEPKHIWIGSIRGLYMEPKHTRPTHYVYWQYTLIVYGDQRPPDFISKWNWLYTGTVYGASIQDIFSALDNTFDNILKKEAHLMDTWMY